MTGSEHPAEASTSPSPSVLHLGCGQKKYPGAFGVDRTAGDAVDLQHDLDDRPWPLPPDQFAKAYLIDVLEHVDDAIGVLEEVHRVCRPGADVVVIGPSAGSHQLWGDPTHRRAFTSRSFACFEEGFGTRHFDYSDARFTIAETTYGKWEDWIYRVRLPWYDRLLQALANRYLGVYERRFLYWYPIPNLYTRLTVEK